MEGNHISTIMSPFQGSGENAHNFTTIISPFQGSGENAHNFATIMSPLGFEGKQYFGSEKLYYFIKISFLTEWKSWEPERDLALIE